MSSNLSNILKEDYSLHHLGVWLLPILSLFFKHLCETELNLSSLEKKYEND